MHSIFGQHNDLQRRVEVEKSESEHEWSNTEHWFFWQECMP